MLFVLFLSKNSSMKKVFEKENEITIYKMGNRTVNWYLITTPSEVYLIDTGFAGFWDQFGKAMSKLGRTFNEVTAVLLTHAHVDHTGFAEVARQRTTAEVFIHELGVDTVTHHHYEIPSDLRNNLWRRFGFLNFIWQMRVNKVLKTKPVKRVTSFKENEMLTFPGKPKAVYSPGHSIDHCAFYLEEHGVLFSGDAICTSSPITLKNYPPHVMLAGDDNLLAMQSLKEFEFIEGEILMLPGHGKPWRGNLKKELPKIKENGVLM